MHSGATTSLPSGIAPFPRVLWRKSSLPDNHVPPDFLAALKARRAELAASPARPSVRGMILHKALPQMTFIGFIALFIALFRALLEGRVGAGEVAQVCSTAGLGAVVASRAWTRYVESAPERKPAAAEEPSPPTTSTLSTTILLPPLVLYLLSPLLLSLTKATTSDTIWPLASGLFVLGGLLGGFEGGGAVQEEEEGGQRGMIMPGTPARAGRNVGRRASVGAGGMSARPSSAGLMGPALSLTPDESLRSSLSLTSTMSACIVLASRLESAHEVFALLGSAALGMGALIWIGQHASGPAPQIALALSLYTTALYLWHPLYAHQRVAGPFSLAQVLLAAIVLVLGVLGPLGMRWGWRWRVR